MMILLALFLPLSASARVVINEVLYDPAGVDTGKEWIELYNADPISPVELGGWEISAAPGNFSTLPNLSLAPRGFLIIRWRNEGINSATEVFTGQAGIETNMGNSAGFAALFNSRDHNRQTIVDYLAYGETGQSWEATASAAGIWKRGAFAARVAEGYSIGLRGDGADTNEPGDWRGYHSPTPGATNSQPTSMGVLTPPPSPSETPGMTAATPSPPTPSAAHSQKLAQRSATSSASHADPPPPPASLLPSTTPRIQETVRTADAPPQSASPASLPVVHINEFLPNPKGSDAQEEWVELWNAGGDLAILDGWKLDDEDGGSRPYTISHLRIPAQGYAVLQRPVTALALNNERGSVRLLTPAGEVVEDIWYQQAPRGASANRLSHGGYRWSWALTPGSTNIIRQPDDALPPGGSSGAGAEEGVGTARPQRGNMEKSRTGAIREAAENGKTTSRPAPSTASASPRGFGQAILAEGLPETPQRFPGLLATALSSGILAGGIVLVRFLIRRSREP